MAATSRGGRFTSSAVSLNVWLRLALIRPKPRVDSPRLVSGGGINADNRCVGPSRSQIAFLKLANKQFAEKVAVFQSHLNGSPVFARHHSQFLLKPSVLCVWLAKPQIAAMSIKEVFPFQQLLGTTGTSLQDYRCDVTPD